MYTIKLCISLPTSKFTFLIFKIFTYIILRIENYVLFFTRQIFLIQLSRNEILCQGNMQKNCIPSKIVKF